jgi:hypothetical protein
VLTVLLFSFFWFLHRKKALDGKLFSLGVVFYILAVLPYIIITRGSAFLESRYYYLPLVGIVMVFASVKLKKNLEIPLQIAALSLLVILSQHWLLIQGILNKKIEMSQERIAIVKQLQQIDISSKKINVFFVKSDVDFIIKDQKLPFQQGITYTLWTIYYKQGVIPDEWMIDSKEMGWNMATEGYYSNGEYGFGYFHSEELLNSTLDQLQPGTYNLVYLSYQDKQLTIDKK